MAQGSLLFASSFYRYLNDSSVLQGTELLYTGRKTCPEILTNYSQKTPNIICHGTERDERSALSSLESVGASFLKGLTSLDKQYCQLGSCLHVLADENLVHDCGYVHTNIM